MAVPREQLEALLDDPKAAPEPEADTREGLTRAFLAGKLSKEEYQARFHAIVAADGPPLSSKVLPHVTGDVDKARRDNIEARTNKIQADDAVGPLEAEGRARSEFNAQYGMEQDPTKITVVDAAKRALTPATLGTVQANSFEAQRELARKHQQGLPAALENQKRLKEAAEAVSGLQASDSTNLLALAAKYGTVPGWRALAAKMLLPEEENAIADFEASPTVADAAVKTAALGMSVPVQRGATVVDVEGPTVYGARILGAMGQPGIEGAGKVAEVTGLASREQRQRTRTVDAAVAEAPEQFLVDMFQGVERGEGAIDLTQAIARTQGYAPGSPEYTVATLAGAAADFLVPWEEMTFAPVTRSIGAASKAYKLAKMVPEEARAAGAVAGVRAELGDVARGLPFSKELVPASLREASVTDVGDITGSYLDRAWKNGREPSLPAELHADMQDMLAREGVKAEKGGKKGVSSLATLEERAARGDVAARGKVRELAVDATKRRARLVLGDDKLVTLTDRTVVTMGEAERLQREVAERLALYGIDPQSLAARVSNSTATGKSIHLLPGESDAIVRLDQVYSRPAPGSPAIASSPRELFPNGTVVEQITPEQYNKLIDRMVIAEAGKSADVRFAIQRDRGLVERVMGGALAFAKQVGGDRRVVEEARHQAAQMVATLDSRALYRNAPLQTKQFITNAKRLLESTPEDVLRELKETVAAAKKEGRDPGFMEAAARAMPREAFAHGDDDWHLLSKAEELIASENPNEADLQRMVDEVLGSRTVGGPDADGDEYAMFQLGSGSESEVREPEDAGRVGRGAEQTRAESMRYALKAWSSRRNAQVGDTASDIMKAYDPRVSLEGLTQDLARQIVQEFRTSHAVPTDRLHELLGKAGVARLADDPEAMFRLAVHWRTQERLKDVATSALDLDFAIGSHGYSKRMRNATRALLSGQASYSYRGANIVLARDPETLTRAAGYLSKLGITTPFGEMQKLTSIPGQGDAWLPDYVVKDLLDSAKRANIPPTTFASNGSILGWLNKQWRDGLLVGQVFPNFKYYIGNAISAPFQMFGRLGLRGTARAFASWLDDGEMVGELLGRTSGWGPSGPGHATLVDPFGRVHTSASLEADIRRLGVDTTQARIENGRRLLAEVEALAGNRPWFKKIVDNHAAYQQFLYDVNGAVDQAFRYGVLVSQIRAGRSVDDAARLAREALYDYNDMSDFEKYFLRRVTVAYSFRRKNLDAFLWMMANHPDRVGRMMRFARDQREVWGEDPASTVADWDDNIAQLIVAKNGQPKLPDGDLDYRYTSELWAGGAMPVPDAINIVMSILKLATGIGPETELQAGQTFGKSLHPGIKIGIETITGADPGSEMDPTSQRANEVPEVLVHLDQYVTGGVLGDFFGIEEADEADPQRQVHPELYTGRIVYVATKPSRWTWVKNGPLGRTILSTLPAPVGRPIRIPTPLNARELLEHRKQVEIDDETKRLQKLRKPR